jgi:outer membrane cobalamin receptor
MSRALAHSFLFLAIAGAAVAGEGALTGTVKTSDGRPVPQIVLIVSGASGTHSLATGALGRFRLAGLTPGDYEVRLQSPGFVLSGQATATVGDGETELDLTLAPAPVREHVVVSATRGEAALSNLGASASALDGDRIAARSASSFLPLLEEGPGVAVARAGGVGAQASAFVRGGEARFTRLLIDGVPVNEPGGAANLGSALPLELERVEVVRGAESSLYGTDALAGVIQLFTRRAAPGEAPGVHAELEGGDFSWKRALGGTSGRSGIFDWNAGLQRVETDNQQPNSAFDSTSGALSIGVAPSEHTTLRAFLRGTDTTTGTPGQTAFGRPDLDASYDWKAFDFGVEARRTGTTVSHQLRVGYALLDQLSLDPINSGSFVPEYQGHVAPFPFSDFPDPLGYQNDTRRLAATYQADIEAGAIGLVTAGADLERETGEIGSRSDPSSLVSPERTNTGVFVQDRVLLGSRVFVTLGGRVEHNDSFGTEAVPRAAVAFRVRDGADATTLRASAGAGIKEPSFLESFGVSFFAQGNPDLKPERSHTFDVGVEQRAFAGRLRAAAAFFHHSYYDQIAYQLKDPATFQGSYVNLGETRAKGVELSLEAVPVPSLRIAANYTYLDGVIVESSSAFDRVYAVGHPLLRRPKHQGFLAADGTWGRVTASANLVMVGERADSDFLGLGLTSNPGYHRLDARLRVRLARGLSVYAAAENLTDESYQDVLGYPALGRFVRVGVSYRSGR